MHPQLTAIAGELSAATDHARALIRKTTETAFQTRPALDRWSVAECLAHLNLTSRAFLPIVDTILARGTATNIDASRRYRRDFKGWLLCRAVEPPVRHRLKTPPPFVPSSTDSRDQVLSVFAQLQDELTRRLEAASGLDLNRLRVASPFDARFSYNLYSGFRVIPAHQRRHLWQAEQVLASIRAAPARP
jgi:DinB superfamily